jgi:hypothetical protein
MTVDSPRSARLASSFDAVAAEYAAARPGYPPALFDAIEELAGAPLAGARTLEEVEEAYVVRLTLTASTA